MARILLGEFGVKAMNKRKLFVYLTKIYEFCLKDENKSNNEKAQVLEM